MCNAMHSFAMIHSIVGSCMGVEEFPPPTSGLLNSLRVVLGHGGTSVTLVEREGVPKPST
eukprot:2840835-Rhodomonas_salina.1